ncbi:MAG: GCN5-related N-acetyltransferase [Frankiales bacterium]|nr:GCN5-related N-acetyltransferase [Frankiales bacterium]
MTSVDITRVATRADLEAFHRCEVASLAHDFVGLPAFPIEEWLPYLDEPESAGDRVHMYLGRQDGVPVASMSLRTPLRDNLSVVNLELKVHPDHRRLGYGRALAEKVLEETRALGRTRVFAAIASRPEGDPLGLALAEGFGAKPVIEDVRRTLDLLVSPPGPRPAAPAGYRVVEWVGSAPEDLVDGAAYLNGRMTLDMPMGEMDYEPEVWDAARYREREQQAVERKRLMIAAAALHESGQVAGITEIAVTPTQPEHAMQWDTIVDPDHRGHGLGLLLKHWNHAQLVEVAPEVRWVNTWNATTNTFMIRVNEAVGYRPMETWTEYQLDL